MKFDSLDFKGTLNPDVYLEWIQAVKRFFEVKGYSDERSCKVANTKRQRAKEGKP